MLFPPPLFFVFFFHLIIPARFRIYLIICGSTIFYAWWKVEYIWLPYLLTAIAYGGVIWMDRASSEPGRRRRTAVTIVALFLPLVFFKYVNFFYSGVLGP